MSPWNILAYAQQSSRWRQVRNYVARKMLYSTPNIYAEKNIRVIGFPRIGPMHGKISLAESVTLRSDSFGYHTGMPFPVTLIADRADATIKVGKQTRLNGCCIHAWKSVEIGDNCLIASGTCILDSHGHTTEPQLTYSRGAVADEAEPIYIGNHVWIGQNVLITKGVSVGEGSIIAAYSVVTSDIPPFSLAGGIPARILENFSEQVSMKTHQRS